MDDSGNILIKRIAKSNVYVKKTEQENAVANEILKLPNNALELDKPVKLFDMKKFQQNVTRELKRAYPDRSDTRSIFIIHLYTDLRKDKVITRFEFRGLKIWQENTVICKKNSIGMIFY